jgi:predicted negative regulator of RcsB-dependent stress response
MDVIQNSDDAAERLKKFLIKYGNLMGTLIIIVLLVIAGAQWWSKHKQKEAAQASVIYENFLVSYQANNAPQVQALSQDLMTQYIDTPYAEMTALLLAKQSVQNGDLPAAVTSLQWAVAHAPDHALKAVAQLRLARVYLSLQQPQNAISALDGVKGKDFLSQANLLKGDAYLAEGKMSDAKTAYQVAYDLATPNTPFASYVAMKLYDLQ